MTEFASQFYSAVAFLVGGVVFAQDSQKVEATGDYSYFSVEPWTRVPSAFCAA